MKTMNFKATEKTKRLAKKLDKAASNGSSKKFFQVFVDMVPEIIALNNECPTAVNVLLAAIYGMGTDSNAVQFDTKTMKDLLNCGESTIYKALKLLKERKFIETVPVSYGVKGYVVNERVAWKKSTDQRSSAMFSAPIRSSSKIKDMKFNLLGIGASRVLRHIPTITLHDYNNSHINNNLIPPGKVKHNRAYRNNQPDKIRSDGKFEAQRV